MLNSVVRIEERKGEKQEQSICCLVRNVGNAKGPVAAKGHGNEHKAELEHIAVLNVRRPPSNPLVRVISSCLEHLRERRREAAGRMVQMLEQNPLELGLRQPKRYRPLQRRRRFRDPKLRKHSTLLRSWSIEERQSCVP